MRGIAFPKNTQQCQECAPASRFLKAAQKEKKGANISRERQSMSGDQKGQLHHPGEGCAAPTVQHVSLVGF